MTQQAMHPRMAAEVIDGATKAIARWMREEVDDEGRPYWAGTKEDRERVEAYLPDLRLIAGSGPDEEPGLLIYLAESGIHGGTRVDDAPPSRGWIVETVWATGGTSYRWFRRQDAARAALLLLCAEHGGDPAPSALSADLSPMNAQFSSRAWVWACDRKGQRKRLAT